MPERPSIESETPGHPGDIVDREVEALRRVTTNAVGSPREGLVARAILLRGAAAAPRRPRIWPWAAAIAAAVIPSPALLWQMSRPARGAQTASQAADGTLAQVVTVHRAVAADATAIDVGRRFGPGADASARVSLALGAIELAFDNGIEMVLEGPCELEIVDAMRATLLGGHAVVRVPDGIDGFQLDTPATSLVDLGTEYAVKVGPNLLTDVQVYDGEVMASSRSQAAGAAFPLRVGTGEAVRFSPQPEVEPQAIEFSEERFLRSLANTDRNPGNGRRINRKRPTSSAIREFGQAAHDAIHVLPAPGRMTIDGRLDEWSPTAVVRRSHGEGRSLDGWMMYDDRHLYIAAHVGDPLPLRNAVNPALDADTAWRGGAVQVRISADRVVGWPAVGNAADYFIARRLEPTEADRNAARNPRLSHLTLWHHAPSGRDCLFVTPGMVHGMGAVNPPGYRGRSVRDPDGLGYTMEYAIPWELLGAADDPPRAGDVLAAVWQVHWSDATGTAWRDQMVEFRNPSEPEWIFVWERAGTWGRAIFDGP
ncbi:MAG: hypothetical protein WCO90_07350 [Planctomycetota bacterium]